MNSINKAPNHHKYPFITSGCLLIFNIIIIIESIAKINCVKPILVEREG